MENADKKQTSETIYDPDSRVERSVRVIKQRQVSSNAAAQKAGKGVLARWLHD